jgi:hypothetical protein
MPGLAPPRHRVGGWYVPPFTVFFYAIGQKEAFTGELAEKP